MQSAHFNRNGARSHLGHLFVLFNRCRRSLVSKSISGLLLVHPNPPWAGCHREQEARTTTTKAKYQETRRSSRVSASPSLVLGSPQGSRWPWGRFSGRRRTSREPESSRCNDFSFRCDQLTYDISPSPHLFKKKIRCRRTKFFCPS